MKTPIRSLLLILALGAARCVPPGGRYLAGRYFGHVYIVIGTGTGIDTAIARATESVLELHPDGSFDWPLLEKRGRYRAAYDVLYLRHEGAKEDTELLVRGDSLIWIFDPKAKAVGIWRRIPPER